jgi:ABC-type nitrate/sulfonate/bicarbonate transport system permease component
MSSRPSLQRARVIAGRVLGPLVLPALLIVAYQLFSMHHHSLFFPSVPAIAHAFVATWGPTGLRQDVGPSLYNLGVGYLAGLTLALAVGLVVARREWLYLVVEPLVAFFLSLPPITLIPIFLVLFGIGNAMQQSLIAFAVFFQVFVNTTDGLRSTNATLQHTAAIYRVRRWRKILLIDLPAASPQILAGARTALSLAVLVMIVSELVGAPHGIGAVTLDAQNGFNYPVMWAGMVLTALLGIVLNALFSLAERPFLRRSGLSEATTSSIKYQRSTS